MCYSPIKIKVGDGYRFVPCGRCLECLKEYQQQWSVRMEEELKRYEGKGVFFTLTYNEESVPKNFIVDYSVIRSKSDYHYDNAHSRVRGEKIKLREAPTQVLDDLGVEYDKEDIIDFNYNRKDIYKFRNNVKKLYGDYVRQFISYDDAYCPINNNMFDTCYSEGIDGDYMFNSTHDYDFDSDFESSVWRDYNPLETEQRIEKAIEEVRTIPVKVDYEQKLDENIKKVISYDFPLEEVASCPNYISRPIMSFNSVRKEDVQGWLKRGARRLSRKGKHFTYFITSEYGPTTLRPHYHGVLFGVTKDDVQFMFEDWSRHFGFYKFDNVDLTKGACAYCAKYCAKGMYEHPLCSKDFFYFKKKFKEDDLPFTEYHSKFFERSIELFGINAPVVDRTFHLISKGLGEKFVKDNKKWIIQDIETYIPDDFNKDTATIKVGIDKKDFDFVAWLTADTEEEANNIAYKIIDTNGLHKSSIHREFQEWKSAMAAFKERFCHISLKGYKSNLPKYYSEKIFNDQIRCSYQSYIQLLHVENYIEKLRSMVPDNATREDIENIALSIAQEEYINKKRRMQKCRDKVEKILNKSKI